MLDLPYDFLLWLAGYIGLLLSAGVIRIILCRMTRMGRSSAFLLSWISLPSFTLAGIVAILALDASNPNYDITLGLAIFILPIFFVPAYIVSVAGSILAAVVYPDIRVF